MAKNLPSRAFAVIIILALLGATTPALAQEEGGAAGEGTGGGAGGAAGVKEEGGVSAERLATGEYLFGETVIEGRLEKPVALFIKRQQPEFKTVRFARDFWDDILRPIDKEEFEKATRESAFDYVKNPILWMAVATAAASGAAAGYQAYNHETGQVYVYGITAGAAAAVAGGLVIIDKKRNRAAK